MNSRFKGILTKSAVCMVASWPVFAQQQQESRSANDPIPQGLTFNAVADGKAREKRLFSPAEAKVHQFVWKMVVHQMGRRGKVEPFTESVSKRKLEDLLNDKDLFIVTGAVCEIVENFPEAQLGFTHDDCSKYAKMAYCDFVKMVSARAEANGGKQQNTHDAAEPSQEAAVLAVLEQLDTSPPMDEYNLALQDENFHKRELPNLQGKAGGGDVEAQYMTGLYFDVGYGVKSDSETAVRWYEKAAGQGHARAMFNLALFHAFGRGIKQDHAKAASLFRQAAEKGDARAQYNLGVLLEEGAGVPRSLMEASEWMKKAAAQDHEEARVWLSQHDKEMPAATGELRFNAITDGLKTSSEVTDLDVLFEYVENGLSGAKERLLSRLLSDHIVYPFTIDGLEGLAGTAKFVQSELEASARRGSLNACKCLAAAFLLGHGVKEDPVQAFDWASRAATHPESDSIAKHMLAWHYFWGVGVEQHRNRGVALLQEAARGDLSEYFNGNVLLGARYLGHPAVACGVLAAVGVGFDQDYAQSAQWFEKADCSGFASHQLAQYYRSGTGVQRDPVKAVELLRRNQSYASSQYRLGMHYYNGTGVAQDLVEAAKCFAAAAENGSAQGQRMYGICCVEGLGVTKNVPEGLRWLQMAVEQGCALAMFNLGEVYWRGLGVAKDPAAAARLYQSGADLGSRACLHMLGVSYVEGLMHEKDVSKGIRWLTRAAEKGFDRAQYSLGYYYERGTGVEPNLNEATKWYRLASIQGNEFAKKRLQALGLSPTATPAEQVPAAGGEAALKPSGTGKTLESKALTMEDLIALLEAGSTTEELVPELKKRGYSGKADASALASLKKAGADVELLLAIREFSKGK